MDPSRYRGNAPAYQTPRTPSSDDNPTANTPQPYIRQAPHQPYFPRTLHQPRSTIPRHGFSPPHEPGYVYDVCDGPHLPGPWAHQAQTNGGAVQPLTPPHQNDENFEPLQQWYAQQSSLNSIGSDQPPPLSQHHTAHVDQLYAVPTDPYSPISHLDEPSGYTFGGLETPARLTQYATLGRPILPSEYVLQPHGQHPMQPPARQPPIQHWPTHLHPDSTPRNQRNHDFRVEAERQAKRTRKVSPKTPRPPATKRHKTHNVVTTPVPPAAPEPLSNAHTSIYFPHSKPYTMNDYHNQLYKDPFDRMQMPPPPKPLDPDLFPQPITNTYEDYKWSVHVYEVNPDKGYDYAQSFLEDLVKNYLPRDRKWHAHTSRGFIQDGNRLTLLVLHNASNPFEWGEAPTSTTSIGVYGRYWYRHNEIHWKTFAPDIRDLLQKCLDQNFIRKKHKWHVGMKKARDKRFHRAYWLAARMQPLGGLLNHTPVFDLPHDSIEEFDDGFEIQEADLRSGWENEGYVDEEVAKRTWAEILRDVEENGGAEFVCEHVATGGTEWDVGV